MTDSRQGRTPEIESLKLRVDGRQAHYLKAGRGSPVVLIHGGASDARDWGGAMTALSPRYSLYAPDLIGYGQSERSEAGYYLSDFSDFILGFIEALGLENPVLVGHSFGGRVCLEIALRHPERVGKLILVDAAGLGKVSVLGNAVLTAFWAIRRLFRLPQPYPKFLAREGEDTLWLCVDELPDLRTPTVILWKRHDPYLPLALARRAAALIPGARLVVLPGCGHAPHKQNPDSFNRLLLDCLDRD
jgi:4,5:9,10-diseco-3-hydroxy-5,9,17-trioxoandrosta-1(10),2-diene-4-oate hydrolase